MKKYLFILAFSGFSLLTALAQDDRNVRKDHTYSTHNYKHPNKAAEARQWETKAGIGVYAPGFSKGPVANYKHSVPSSSPAGGVVVPHTPTMDVALRNYKIQRVNLSRSSIDDQPVSQPILVENP